MATLNHVLFIGRLGNKPDEIKDKSNGKPFIPFSLVVDQGKDQPTMWLNVTCWDKLAETVEKYACKGMLVYVQGKLQMRKYTDKTKTEQTSVEVIAGNIQLLEKKPKEGDGLPDEVLPEA